MTQRLRFVPALDGLRGIAVLLVVLRHAWADRIGGGGVIGVALFFVLSGYLITTVIADEWQARTAVSFRAFFARRALRLLPALFLAISVYLVVASIALRDSGLHDALLSCLFALTYLSGYASFAGFPVTDELGPTWSLAVEEQFYLMWPILLVFLLHRGWPFKRMAYLAFAFAAGAAMLRAATWEVWGSDIYKLPSSWIDGLLIGCGLALLARGDDGGPNLQLLRSRRLQSALVLLATGFLAALCLGPSLPESAWTYRVLLLLVSLAAGFLIISVTDSRIPWLLKPLDRPALRWVGRRSYAIYLWNAILLFGIPQAWQPRRLWLVVGVVATFVVAELSWRLVEARALALKSRFESTRSGHLR